MLGAYRVVDLTDERGQLCGQILGDLGAEVILVEPPGGSSSRRMGPFAEDSGDPERSLWFWSYNRGKKSIVADLHTEAGRARIRELAASADFLIESFAPGYLESIGLGYEHLRELNPRLIVVSITPFGLTGPRAQWAASDLTVMAASGVLNMTGDHDRAPVRVVLPQAFLHASADGAVGALMALQARERDGLGQHVDVSAQASTLMATQTYGIAAAWNDAGIDRFSGGLRLGPLTLQFVHATKDGYVSVTFLFGSAIGPFTQRLMDVMCEQGFVDEATRDKDWVNYTVLLGTGAEPVSELDRCTRAIGAFCASHTKDELFEIALQRRLLIVPVSTTEDLLRSPQLAERDFWREVEHPEEGRSFRYPGPFAKFSATPLRYRRRAPRVGEDDAAIEPRRAATIASTRQAPRGARELPLAGVKVADFAWVMAGPAGTRYLADYGATQVKIESATRIDTARTLGPNMDGVPGPERSAIFSNVNVGKLGLTVNLSVPEGRELALRMIQWADVVTESYTPKAMRSWGLDYASLRKVKPGLIMLSSCLGGQSGPWCELAGFGTMGAQLAGFGELAGWPDRAPAGPFGAYTDYIAPKFTAAAILAALDHRRRTGEGQYIDLSQAECSQQFMAPAILDYEVNGRVMRRDGNRSLVHAPHGVYPSAEDDRWVAIAVENDEQWQGLRAALGNPQWAEAGELQSPAGRLAHAAELDERLGAWTRERSLAECEERLQAQGVPVHRSSNTHDVCADPQLAARGHLVQVEHAELGRVTVEQSRFRLSDSPTQLRRAGPTFGQDNEYVLREILGLDDEEVVRYIAAGALE